MKALCTLLYKKMAKMCIYRIQDGRQSAILDPIFTNIELVRDFIVIHNISGFEDDWTKIADSRALTGKPDARTNERTHVRPPLRPGGTA